MMKSTPHVSDFSDPAQATAEPTRPSTREMLSHIGCETDEYLRTSREKVNIAQTAHDLVCGMVFLYCIGLDLCRLIVRYVCWINSSKSKKHLWAQSRMPPLCSVCLI